MHKFFVPIENIVNDIAIVNGEDVKHIYKVLRLSEGDKIQINNCDGGEFLGQIMDINKTEVSVKLLEKLTVNNESPIEVYLYQGLPKSAKMDLIAQKGTELGVRAITPVITGRVVVKNEIGEFKKVDRWNRIALEACKQCKRSLIPKINVPIDFNEFMDEIKHMDLVVVPYENEDNYGIKALKQKLHKGIKKVAVFIGPEDGFEEEEIKSLKDNGAEIVTLGPRILRTETAGFVCTSLLMYELGDLGGADTQD